MSDETLEAWGVWADYQQGVADARDGASVDYVSAEGEGSWCVECDTPSVRHQLVHTISLDGIAEWWAYECMECGEVDCEDE